jgi:hypothetical protein
MNLGARWVTECCRIESWIGSTAPAQIVSRTVEETHPGLVRLADILQSVLSHGGTHQRKACCVAFRPIAVRRFAVAVSGQKLHGPL